MCKKNSLIERLIEKFPDSSKRTLNIWIKNGRILLDDKTITNPLFMMTNEKITLKKKDKLIKENIKIIYEDTHILIIEKPDNLLSVPKDTPNSVNVLKILRVHFQTKHIFAVHRIDLESSGLLLFAKSNEALLLFKEIFKKHEITRKYIAVIEGHLNPKSGTLKSYLKENEDLSVSSAKDGKLAITHFETLYETKKYSFLSLSLQTGRKHQIRVQLKDLGYPIFGDKKYGKKEGNRMFLHAYLLEFFHPFLKRKCTFYSHLPIDFQNLAGKNILGKI